MDIYVLTVGDNGVFLGAFSTLENAVEFANRYRDTELNFEPYSWSRDNDLWHVNHLWLTPDAIEISRHRLDIEAQKETRMNICPYCNKEMPERVEDYNPDRHCYHGRDEWWETARWKCTQCNYTLDVDGMYTYGGLCPNCLAEMALADVGVLPF